MASNESSQIVPLQNGTVGRTLQPFPSPLTSPPSQVTFLPPRPAPVPPHPSYYQPTRPTAGCSPSHFQMLHQDSGTVSLAEGSPHQGAPVTPSSFGYNQRFFQFSPSSLQTTPHNPMFPFPPPLTHMDQDAGTSPHHDMLGELFPSLRGLPPTTMNNPTGFKQDGQQTADGCSQVFIPQLTSPTFFPSTQQHDTSPVLTVPSPPSTSTDPVPSYPPTPSLYPPKDQQLPDIKQPSCQLVVTTVRPPVDAESREGGDLFSEAEVGLPLANHFSTSTPGERFIPPSTSDPGQLGFKLHFSPDVESGTGNSPLTFCRDIKTLFVKPLCDFAVTFAFDTPPPPGSLVRALVCYKDPIHTESRGPITRCLKHLTEEKDSEHAEYFVRSRATGVNYGELYGHKCVTIPVEAMAVTEDQGVMAVYSYSVCYTSCIVGNGRNKPAILTIFSLISNRGREIARASFTVRVCACPHRDRDRLLAAPSTTSTHEPSLPRRRTASERDQEETDAATTESPEASANRADIPSANPFGIDLPLPPHLNFTGQAEPDEDGCYTFTWRLKERKVYNMLCLMRAGYRAKPANI